MRDCCKDAFIEGLKHISNELRHSIMMTKEEIVDFVDYSIRLLERQKEFKMQEQPQGIEL